MFQVKIRSKIGLEDSLDWDSDLTTAEAILELLAVVESVDVGED